MVILVDNIWGILFSATVISAVVSQGITWLRDWRKDSQQLKQAANYSAVRIIHQLESFALACANDIDSTMNAKFSNGNVGKYILDIPSIGSFPDDIEWKSFDAKLVIQIFDLRNDIKIRQKTINDVWDVCPENAAQEFFSQSCQCAYSAWVLAQLIRKSYKFKSINLDDYDGNPMSIVFSEYKKAMKRKEEN